MWRERKNATRTDKRNDSVMKEISAQKLCAGTVSGNDTQGGRLWKGALIELPGVCVAACCTADAAITGS
jgi:hypothetical protein